MTAVRRRVAVVVLACLPLEAAWFRGNTHAHTNLSDGQDPPELVAKWYQQHGYDFLFLTDHNGVTPVAGLNSVFGNGGRFLILPGEEVTSDFGRWRVHVNALGAQRKATPQTGRTAAEGLQRTIDAARGSGGLAQINHPNFFWSLTADDIAATKGATLLEIFSGHRFVNTMGAGPDAPSAEEIWDRVLSKGTLLYATAGDDMHTLDRSAYPEGDLPGRGWIMVRAARLGAAEIMQAIEKGDFYATNGIELSQYSDANGQIAVTVAVKDQVRYLIEFIGRDGKVLQQTTGSSATYRMDGSEGYVRARVTDSNNHRAWMQPVMAAKNETTPVTVAAPPAPPTETATTRQPSPTTPPVVAGGPVRAWESSVKLRTWEEGPADPHPQFPILGASRPWYPYPIRSSFGKQSREQNWRALNLENEYLTCSVLPDLGGHLYSCRDKISGLEMFHANPSLKKSVVGLRGAWAAMGVELNFPVGHSLLTTSPVDSGITGTASSASVWVGATDRLTGMRWRVEFTLDRGVAALRQKVYLENGTPVRHRYYWWTNASIPMQADTRFVIPTKLIATHGLTSIDPWPINSTGIDRSLPSSYPSSIGLFAHETREPFIAVYQPATRSGTLHYADPAEVPGKKIWTWGRDAAPEMRRTLSDDGSLYVELQAGLFPNQETYGLMEPGASRSFTEYWMPVRTLDGISQASPHGILFFGRKNGILTAQLLPVHAASQARIQILNGTTPLLDERVSLKPEQVVERALPTAIAGRFTFRLLDSAGKELLANTEGELRATGAEAVALGTQPQSGWKELNLDRAIHYEQQGELRLAADDYRKMLEQSPADARALLGAGRTAAILHRFDEAQTHLAAAVKADPKNAEAHYYLGLALAGRGDEVGARREWAQARSDKAFGAMAAVEAAAGTARSGDFKAALAALRASGSSLARTLVMEAALARSLEDAGASRSITRALAQDPTDSAARFEQSLQGAGIDTLWDHLAADAERVLEIADLYMRWGLYQDAASILARSYPSIAEDQLEPGAVPPGMDPLVSYYLGYCHERMKQDAADYYRGGSQLSTRYVFPSRASSRPVLEAAIRSNPEDGGAHYLLGLWFLNSQMVAEGGRELQLAQKLRPTLAEARTLLSGMKLPVTAAPREVEAPAPAKTQEPAPAAAQAAAPAPRTAAPSATPVGSPAEAAASALMDAAEGDLDRARKFFTAANFPAEKQEDSVREAYIELELQRLLGLAADKKCAEVDRMLTNIGAYDKTLPFTFHPFNNLMKGARFQYYLGEAAAACDEKEARKIWEKVSRMRPDLASVDFSFPFLAATRLMSPSEPAVGLDHLRRYLQSASGATRSTVFYNQGMLLLVGGRRKDAVDSFRSGLRGAPAGMVRYLNALALRQAEQQ